MQGGAVVKKRESAAEVANRRLIDCLAKGCLSMALHGSARVWVSGCATVCVVRTAT